MLLLGLLRGQHLKVRGCLFVATPMVASALMSTCTSVMLVVIKVMQLAIGVRISRKRLRSTLNWVNTKQSWSRLSILKPFLLIYLIL